MGNEGTLIHLSTRVEQELYDGLEKVAEENERSIAAEMRIALRLHVAAHEQKRKTGEAAS